MEIESKSFSETPSGRVMVSVSFGHGQFSAPPESQLPDIGTPEIPTDGNY